MPRTTLPIVTITFCLTAAVAGCASDAPRPGNAARPGAPTATATAPNLAPSSLATHNLAPTGRAPSAPAPSTPPAAAPNTSTKAQSGSRATAKAGTRPLDPAAAPSDPACAPAAILPTAKRLVDNPSAGLTVASVEIPACRNGYARVFTVPTRTPQRFEGDQLFLRRVNNTWTLVGRGASTDCGDADLPPAVAKACAALA